MPPAPPDPLRVAGFGFTLARITVRSSRARFAASFMRQRIPQRSAATQAGLTQALCVGRCVGVVDFGDSATYVAPLSSALIGY